MLLADAPTVLRAVSSIIVDRETRQRSTIDKDVEILAEQMSMAGQIQPIVIHADGRLIAGERRLTAARKLGWSTIKATVIEELPATAAYLIELLENIGRKQLSWQDEARGIFNYHVMRAQSVPGWTAQATASDLGWSASALSKYLQVAKRLEDPEVAACPSLQGAFNLLQGRAERAVAAAHSRGLEIAESLPQITPAGTKAERTADVEALIGGGSLEELDIAVAGPTMDILDAGEIAAASLKLHAEAQPAVTSSDLILTEDFLTWASVYDGPKFDVLHIDFPYGKNYSGSNTRRTGKAHIAPLYKDSPDVFWTLLEALFEHQDRLAFPIAHCIFWFDMEYYAPVRESFERAGWKLVQPHPLIWTKPYQGVAADTRRRPRHCYETALFLSRGDRKLVRLDQDYYNGRVDEKLHLNQKSIAMLKHFLSMVVDEHTAVLDPTCGSGSAIAAARYLNCQRALGLELDSSNAEVARFVTSRPEELKA